MPYIYSHVIQGYWHVTTGKHFFRIHSASQPFSGFIFTFISLTLKDEYYLGKANWGTDVLLPWILSYSSFKADSFTFKTWGVGMSWKLFDLNNYYCFQQPTIQKSKLCLQGFRFVRQHINLPPSILYLREIHLVLLRLFCSILSLPMPTPKFLKYLSHHSKFSLDLL